MPDAAGDRADPGPVPGLYAPYYPALFAFFLSFTGSEYEAARLCGSVLAACLEDEHWSPAPRQRKVGLFRAARLAARAAAWRAPEAPRAKNGDGPVTDALSIAVRSLPALEREAISLAFDAELSCGEIGEVLSLAEQEAAQLIVRALRRLKGRVGET